MKNILIASYDMEVGGVERSLAGMLSEFDYDRHDIDLMLFCHRGDFMELLPAEANLLPELPQYATFRHSIAQTISQRYIMIGIARLLSRAAAALKGRLRRLSEPGYVQMQLMWKYSLPFLPGIEREYDAAISYLWPHDFVAEKVKAKLKVAWVHTDYSTITTDAELDLKVWRRFDAIIAVSDACKEAFLSKYGELRNKVHVIENMTSPESIRALARQAVPGNPLPGDSRFKLLTVARLSHAKGIDQAVKAMKELRDRGYDALVWYVVGYGGEEDAIRQLISQCGLEEHFILLGKQTNPYPYMLHCDLYVQPSRYEGKAVTVTEAQVLGKPVLIANYSTAASQVTHGADGYIAGQSVQGIADGIAHLYDNRDTMRRLAQVCSGKCYGNKDELRKLYRLVGSESERRGLA